MTRFILLLTLLFQFQNSFACNLSFVSLISYTNNGNGTYTVSCQLCIGAGRTGLITGTDSPTNDIFFGFYGSGPINVVSFSPNDNFPWLTSTYTGCEMPGYDIGPQGPPYDTDASIYYLFDPLTFPACNNGFTCNISTALCGDVTNDCFVFNFTLDAAPDSLRVFGVEGASNFWAGCSPNMDMRIGFTNGLGVEWGEINADYLASKEVQINWETFSEKNNAQFEIQSLSEDGWKTKGYSDGSGTTQELKKYTFKDENPETGNNYYRILQRDTDGQINYSKAISVYVDPTIDEVHIYPNPGSGIITINAKHGTSISLYHTLSDAPLLEQIIKNDEFQFSTEGLPNGIYFLRSQFRSGEVEFSKIAIQ